MKKVIKEIKFEGCNILLKDYETDFINEMISDKEINFKNVRKSLIRFMEASDINYFSKKHVNEIARNICEEVGRNYSTKNKNNTVSASSSGNFEDEYILANSNEIFVSDGVDTERGDFTSNVKDKKGKKVNKAFKDDGDYDIFVKNLRLSNINYK